MKSRPFGSLRTPVSEIGVGTWQFGGDWGKVSDDEAVKTVLAAMDAGVTFIDTADVYGAGRSEQLIGEALKQRFGSGEKRENIFIATKLGRLKGYPDKYSLDLFRACCEDSIKRLGVDVLDLTQTHCIPHERVADGEVFDWLRTLKKEGLIKRFGASVESMDEALDCLKHAGSGSSGGGLESLQIIFNIFRRRPIGALFEQAKAKNVALIVRLPLASGLLAGKYTKDTTFDEKDHRHYNRDGDQFNAGETFAGLPFEKGVELADMIKPMVPPRSRNMSMAQFAIRWCLDFDAVTTVIPGAKNPTQATDNAAASDLPRLSRSIHNDLVKFYTEHVAAHIRGVY